MDCSYTAKVGRSILASTGFTLEAENTLPKKLGKSEIFTVQPGNNTGEALVYIIPVRDAIAYLFLHAPSPMSNNAWLQA